MQFAHLIRCISHCMAQDEPPNVSVKRALIPSSCHPRCVFERSLSVSSCLSFSCFSLLLTSSLPHSTCTLPSTSSPMSTASREFTTAPSHNKEYCTMAIYHPPTGYEPNVLDDFHYSETSATTRPSEKRYLHHCSFRSEKNQRTGDKLITLKKKVCCQLRPFSHTQDLGDPCTNLVRAKNESQVAKWKTKESGFSLKDALQHWKQEEFQPQASLHRQDLGFNLDELMAPQPLGPVTRAPRTITGIQGAGWTETLTLVTKMHFVRYCYGVPANNATQAFLHG